MKFVDIVVLLYAILCIVFGIIGYTGALGGKPSPMSLAGCVAGGLLVGTLALAKTNPRVARISAAVITLLLLGNFAPKFFKTNDWIPAGVMTIASAIALLVLVGGHFAAMSQRKREA